MNTNSTIEAVAEFVGLSNRATHPDGDFDKAGRWYPHHKCACCSHIRAPSRAYPYSLLVHCRTAEHVYRSFNLSCTLEQFRRACRAANKQFRLSRCKASNTAQLLAAAVVADLLPMCADPATPGLPTSQTGNDSSRLGCPEIGGS